MKKCSLCAEEIQDEAIRCKHCGQILNKKPIPKALKVLMISIAVIASLYFAMDMHTRGALSKLMYTIFLFKPGALTPRDNGLDWSKASTKEKEQLCAELWITKGKSRRYWMYLLTVYYDSCPSDDCLKASIESVAEDVGKLREAVNRPPQQLEQNEELIQADKDSKESVERIFYSSQTGLRYLRAIGIAFDPRSAPDYLDIMKQLHSYEKGNGSEALKRQLIDIFGFYDAKHFLYIFDNYDEWKRLKGLH